MRLEKGAKGEGCQGKPGEKGHSRLQEGGCGWRRARGTCQVQRAQGGRLQALQACTCSPSLWEPLTIAGGQRRVCPPHRAPLPQPGPGPALRVPPASAIRSVVSGAMWLMDTVDLQAFSPSPVGPCLSGDSRIRVPRKRAVWARVVSPGAGGPWGGQKEGRQDQPS